MEIFSITGGYVYIYHSPEMPYAWKNDDGYKWSEILHQMDMVTAKGKLINKIFFKLTANISTEYQIKYFRLSVGSL